MAYKSISGHQRRSRRLAGLSPDTETSEESDRRDMGQTRSSPCPRRGRNSGSSTSGRRGARGPSPTPATPGPSSGNAQGGSVASTSQGSSSNGTSSSTLRQSVLCRGGMPGVLLPGAVLVKGESFCDCPKQGRELTCTCGEEDSFFEWTWDPETKSTASHLSEDNREVRFHVDYSCGTAAVRATQPMSDRQYFWEIKMTTPVYGTDMMVGVGTPHVNLDAYIHNFCSLLGRDGESWGLSYLGLVHHKGEVHQFAPKFGQGTIIGVHLDMWHGEISFYKNRRPLGVAYRGLNGKILHPIVSSTAARSGMKLIKACSFRTSLQFMCCQVLRKKVAPHLDVTDVISMPPGLKAFLTNNLGWLLRQCDLEDVRKPRKRPRSEDSGSGQAGGKKAKT